MDSSVAIRTPKPGLKLRANNPLYMRTWLSWSKAPGCTSITGSGIVSRLAGSNPAVRFFICESSQDD